MSKKVYVDKAKNVKITVWSNSKSEVVEVSIEPHCSLTSIKS